MVLAINQGVKFANILLKHTNLNHHPRSAYIPYLNCVSKNVVYLFTCKTCHKQYTGSTEEFRSRFNNYRCSHRNFLRNKKVKQESFHAHFAEDLHQGESDWEVRLIDQGVSVDDVRDSYW